MIVPTIYTSLASAAAETTATAPWWGVPIIAGGFLLIGASLAFLSTLASDKRKAKRDKDERIMIDTRTVGLEYLDAATELANVIRTQQDPSRALKRDEYLKAMQASLIRVNEKWRKFELFADEKALETGGRLDAACVLLSISAFGSEIPHDQLQDLETARYAFINTLRKASGVGEIAYVFPDAATKERLEEGITEIKNDFGADLEKNYGTPREK
ncbi:hypothetical protein [Paeniglutamicibacter sulfureus]|uniref:DUF4760 domain-containing protein n=1 Tax=Paeniglutamicibacter sulfureus TaxID=43666 RepID=A0ABU2BEK6_9MICC|nr:hypothetical protein [Paeniglutamicibacter sulfureus]MDR7356399.1 hypothetical protein [Paeniglutamicibacter sulfureus]